MTAGSDWIQMLFKLKSAFLEYDRNQTKELQEALLAACGEFTSYVKVRQGILRESRCNLDLFDRWNDFVQSGDQSRNEAGTRLLDAIDEAIAVAYKNTGRPGSIIYNIGAAGVFSTGAAAHMSNIAITQHSGSHAHPVDLSELAEELVRLRSEMRTRAETREQDAALGSIAEAEAAARSGDQRRVLDNLKAAGEWALDVATKIGVEIATAALKRSLELPK